MRSALWYLAEKDVTTEANGKERMKLAMINIRNKDA